MALAAVQSINIYRELGLAKKPIISASTANRKYVRRARLFLSERLMTTVALRRPYQTAQSFTIGITSQTNTLHTIPRNNPRFQILLWHFVSYKDFSSLNYFKASNCDFAPIWGCHPKRSVLVPAVWINASTSIIWSIS